MTLLSLIREFRRFRRRAICRLALHFPTLVRWLDTPRPLFMHRHDYRSPSTIRDLLVLLPGIGDSAEDFERHGFVDLVRRLDWPVDILMVDAHYGYYADRTVLEELHTGVFLPAKAYGYRHTWLAGISLGGFGALLYASRYPRDVTGVVAMAPFLGRRELIEQIGRAGSLAAWTDEDAEKEDYPKQLWQWLRRSLEEHSGPKLYLAFGERDPFASAQRLLAASLSRQQVFIESGAHDWATWRRLWARFLSDSAGELK
ncbi:MAG TPA: alpha/beta hydrolase-fold protein [Nitrospiraceae bacterium]|nr:alpha/beta hydrolase-fold protein [Nitrospiraceae bacterium]